MPVIARDIVWITNSKSKPKVGFVGQIDHETENNSDFRRVLYTGKNLQLVLMAVPPGEDIGCETHDGHDQFFRIEKGRGEIWIDGHCSTIMSDDAVLVPAGARHNIVNTGFRPMKLYTLYAPPQHRDGIEQATRPDATGEEEHFDGVTTE